jgi:hypothetical protein
VTWGKAAPATALPTVPIYSCWILSELGYRSIGIYPNEAIDIRMAGPAQLVDMVSSTTGIPRATIVDIDRRLVKANLRAKGGRGLHAARMTSIDAARLITALLASSQANASVEAVERYARTRVDPARSSDGGYRAAALDDLMSLPAEHNFVAALAALIEGAARGALAALISKGGDEGAPRIEVFAFTRATHGRIRVSGLLNKMTASVEYLPAPPARTAGRGRKAATRRASSAEEPLGDLEQSRRITEHTILAVARLLAEDDND